MAERNLPHRGEASLNDDTPTKRRPFPKTPEDFEQDERVAFSREDDHWILEGEDGSEWEWTEYTKKWVLVLSKELFDKQQEAYKKDGVDEDEPAEPQRKRKNEDDDTTTTTIKKARQKPSLRPAPEKRNTAIYVTSLPDDADIPEIECLFSRFGVIAEEIDSGSPRIKLYTDDAGKPKGDALIVYFRPESVALAITMADDTDFRLGQSGAMGKMKVVEADRAYKRQKDDEPGKQGAHGEGGEGAAAGKPKKKGPSKDQKKVMAKNQKMNSKLADWSDDDTASLPTTSTRHDKLVYLSHMFTLAELRADPAALLDIKEDVREECAKLGHVTNCVLYDQEAEGIVSVRFANAQAAKECVKVMDGRHFGGLKVGAWVASGEERYRKSDGRGGGEGGGEGVEGQKGEGGEEKRLEAFGEWLESDGKMGEKRVDGEVEEALAIGSNT